MEKPRKPGASPGSVEEYSEKNLEKASAYSGKEVEIVQGIAAFREETPNAPTPKTKIATAPVRAPVSVPMEGGAKARRGGRISKRVAILLFGTDADGRVFTEETNTVVLSLHGAGIVSHERLIPEQELILRWNEAGRETEVRVVGEIAQQDAWHTYGVAFVDENLDFWEMEFPETTTWQERPAVLWLECGGCRGIVELLNGDFEYDICAIHGGLTKYCEECGLLTVWRKPDDRAVALRKAKKSEEAQAGGNIPVIEAESAKVEVQDFVLPIAEPAAAKEVERRARVRAKVSFMACVRSKAFGEEIVQCIDMARGGVSFRTPNIYEKGAKIEIAVPFAVDAQEAPAIFVKGRIANVKELGEGMWRCGVEFLR